MARRCVRRDGTLALVHAGRVVADDERGLLLWVDTGSTVLRRTTLEGAPTRKMGLAQRHSIPTILSAGSWHGNGVLILTPPAAAHSIWWFFGEHGGFRGWYLNLETPAVRWPGGIDLEDQALDIWVHPDRTWLWKDEDEFEERTGHPGYWSAEEALEIRAEGERLIAVAEAGTFPFDGSWIDFAPDPQWTPATLRPDWDTVVTSFRTP